MRILFYLPVASRTWLTDTGLPLIERAARDADVHVIVPHFWMGTGVSAPDFEELAQKSGAIWHHYGVEDHHELRMNARSPQQLLRLVRAIAPDYVLCRSADIETPRAFPGKIFFLMEGDYPPMPPAGRIRLTGFSIFDHGMLPPLDKGSKETLHKAVSSIGLAVAGAARSDADARSEFLAAFDLPATRPIIGMPLEHDGPDNFFMHHAPTPENAAFVRQVLTQLSDEPVLALTLHPAQRNDPQAVKAVAELSGARVRILQTPDGSDLTPMLARHCDALLFRDSKSIIWAGLFGKPIFRQSRFATASWLNPHATLGSLEASLGNSPPETRSEDALLWLGFHLANQAFDPADADLCLMERIECAERPSSPEIWARNLDREAAAIAAAASSLATPGA